MAVRGDKFAVVYVDGDVPQLPIQLGQLLVDTSLVSPGNVSLKQCTDVDPVTYEAVGGGGGSGTVTNVATGTGLTGGPITTTGTIQLSAGSIASLAKADTATQPGANVSTLVNDAGYITAETVDRRITRRSLPVTTSTMGSDEMTVSVSGAASGPAYAGTSAFTRIRQNKFTTSTSANQAAGARNSSTNEGVSGADGYRVRLLCGFTVGAAAQRVLIGLADSAALGAAEPSARSDVFFLGKDSTDTDLQIMHNDATGTCTKVPLTGITWASLQDTLLEVILSTPAGGTTLTYLVRNLNTGATIASGTVNSNLPTTTVCMVAHAEANNAATGVAITMHVHMIESAVNLL